MAKNTNVAFEATPTPEGFYSFTEDGTTVEITGVTDEQGASLAASLKGQIAASTDFQLKSAIRNSLSRFGANGGLVEIKIVRG